MLLIKLRTNTMYDELQRKKIPIKSIVTTSIFVGALLLAFLTFGINDAGYRTVVQYPTGTMYVKQDPGFYPIFFGKTTEYPDFLTYDFSADDGRCDFAEGDGVKVRYQDGGEGAVCGLVRIALPNSEAQMLEFHTVYRDTKGVRSKLLNQAIPKALNLTAAFMTSEEGYATKRSEFIQMGEDQAKRGIYKTTLVEKTVEVGIDSAGEIEYQTKQVPEPIMGADGLYITNGSDFEKYGVTVEQFDVKAWDFETKTLDQISKKREAEMAIVTSKANANKAYYEEEQAVAEGKMKVAKAEYEELTKAKREIVNADKERQMAVIKANQLVAVQAEKTKQAVEYTNEQTELAKAAVETASATVTLAKAEAFRKKSIIEADNGLKDKLDAEVKIQANWATAYQNRDVPQTVTVLGGNGGSTTTGGDQEVTNFLRLKTAEVANNLSYDRQVSNKR